MNFKDAWDFISMLVLTIGFIGCQVSSPSTIPTPSLHNNDVDLSPLLTLELQPYMGQVLSDIVDIKKISSLPGVTFQAKGPRIVDNINYYYKDFNIIMDLDDSPENVSYALEVWCKPFSIYQTNINIPNVSHKYCVSHLTEGNAHSIFFAPSQPTGTYIGTVGIQKGNLGIYIIEASQTTDRTIMNETVKQLANAISVPKTYENNLDLTPLLDLNLPDNMGQVITDTINWETLNTLNMSVNTELSKQEHELVFIYEINDPKLGNAVFNISLSLDEVGGYDNPFLQRMWCKRPIFMSHFSTDDKEFNCVTYLIEPQMEVKNTNETYRDNIVVYKGNYLITIEEYTNTLDRTLMNEVIKQISEIIIIPNSK